MLFGEVSVKLLIYSRFEFFLAFGNGCFRGLETSVPQSGSTMNASVLLCESVCLKLMCCISVKYNVRMLC